MCLLCFENNLLTIEGVRFASISKKTPLSKLSFAFVSLALPLLIRAISLVRHFSEKLCWRVRYSTRPWLLQDSENWTLTVAKAMKAVPWQLERQWRLYPDSCKGNEGCTLTVSKEIKAVPWQLQRQWRLYLDSCKGNEGCTLTVAKAMKAVPWELQRQWRLYLDSCKGNEGCTLTVAKAMKAVPWQLERQWRLYLDSCKGNEGCTLTVAKPMKAVLYLDSCKGNECCTLTVAKAMKAVPWQLQRQWRQHCWRCRRRHGWGYRWTQHSWPARKWAALGRKKLGVSTVSLSVAEPHWFQCGSASNFLS